MYVALIDTEKKEIILSEEHVEHYEETDADPETGKRKKVLVTEREATEVRAHMLELHAGSENASGAHLAVVVSKEPYAFPEEPTTSSTKEE